MYILTVNNSLPNKPTTCSVKTLEWYRLFLCLFIPPAHPFSVCCNHFSQLSDFSDHILAH